MPPCPVFRRSLAAPGAVGKVAAMTPPLTLRLASPEQTCALAVAIGARLVRGDTLLLEGPIGAGKTHFARCLIQSRLTTPEDVPSPSFTLVQTYDTAESEVWHSDLYRLTSPDQIEDLGLAEAFDQAICLVEWPDRLGDLAPATALWLRFETPAEDPQSRMVTLWSDDPRWAARLQDLPGVAA